MFSSSLLDVPRPFVDPIHSLLEALGIASLVYLRPRTSSTTVLVLDAQRRGVHLNRFAPLSRSVFHDIVADASRLEETHSVVVFSSRTGNPISADDPELFHTGNAVFTRAGICWLDWVVIGTGGLYCPRSLLHQPDPWPASATCL